MKIEYYHIMVGGMYLSDIEWETHYKEGIKFIELSHIQNDSQLGSVALAFSDINGLKSRVKKLRRMLGDDAVKVVKVINKPTIVEVVDL